MWASFGLARDDAGFSVAFPIGTAFPIGAALSIGVTFAIDVALDAGVGRGVSVAFRFAASFEAAPGVGVALDEDVADCGAGFGAPVAFGVGTGVPAGTDADLGA
jgi:hypothetical protein